MNLLQTKRDNVKRLESDLRNARNGGASQIGKVRTVQNELRREQAELVRLEARLRELKELLACLDDI